MMTSSNWFIKSYLFLYILSPILNAFVETVPRVVFKKSVDSIFYNVDCIWMVISRICDIHIIGLFTSVIYRIVSSCKICKFI